MPAATLDQDVDVITSLGVKIRFNTRVGKDIAMDALREEFDAVLIAIGLQMGRSTRIPGTDLPGVETAVDLLARAAAGEAITAPESAVVIGGGNVAMDIARTLARLQKQQLGQVRITVTALEDFEHFLADPEEVTESKEEGIEIFDARGPREILAENGRVAGLKTWKVLSIFDDRGRFAPSYDEGDERTHPGTMVVEAIGQMSDVSLLGEALTEELEWNRGRLKVDAQGRASVPWLWAAGDMVRGPDVVTAVADGHRVAASIDAYLAERQAAA
jgi:glutamate synthase (NADPH/NADH) small chain